MLRYKILDRKNISPNILKKRMRLTKKNYTIEIVNDKRKWDTILQKIGNFDFYHTHEYHQISIKENEKAVLFVFTKNDSLIAMPFVIRPIKDSGYNDITSVYGYVGPISRNIDDNWDNSIFKTELYNFFKTHRIISVFSTLNPYIQGQEVVLDKIGEIQKLGPVVNIDLTQTITKQRENYSKITKRYLNKVEKLFTFKIGSSTEDILKFIELYYANMIRVNATKKYYFNTNYFFNLINSKEFETDVIHAILNETNEVVSSAIMVRTNKKIVQYHISGTAENSLNLSPMRYLIDKMRILASEKGYEYFNLGGGLGSKQDSLFDFKATFSKDFKDFKIWTLVYNQKIYDKLVAEKKITGENTKNNFFPSYRK